MMNEKLLMDIQAMYIYTFIWSLILMNISISK